MELVAWLAISRRTWKWTRSMFFM